jgi:hypothetical protein
MVTVPRHTWGLSEPTMSDDDSDQTYLGIIWAHYDDDDSDQTYLGIIWAHYDDDDSDQTYLGII